MSLAAGTKLGPYEVIAPLGAGGMGEVYRARDPRLARQVAIKVLAPELASDPGALARFEREAMSVARLSHPNILSIFEFVHDTGLAFVVTELVEGETLRATLDAGRLPARRAVAYALQIAKGIAAAHSRGVVHRDLKPENVMVTRDDHVKILDFGLAKPTEASADELTRAGAATSAGTLLGTFGYMAPEQVRGLAVDHRVDIFAFGAVVYEMLAGARAFRRETGADTLSAILTTDPPDLETLALSIDPALARIVRRCLEKLPERRFQSANDLAFALETLTMPSTASTTASMSAVGATPPRPGRAWVPWVAAGVTGIVAAVAFVALRPSPPVERSWNFFTRISEAAGEETAPTLSPDGGSIAYAMRVNGSWGIYSQRVGGRNPTAIIDDANVDEGGPSYSPDGTQIAFHEGDEFGGIFVAGATGESVRRLTDIGFEPAWSPDGTQIAFATEEIGDPSTRQAISVLYVVPSGGGQPRKVVEGDAVQPSWSPSGGRIVYWSNRGGQRDIFTVVAAGGMPAPLTDDPALDWSPVWSPDGRYVYFSSDRGGASNLWRVAVDQSSGSALNVPEPVTAGVQASAALPRFSKDGSRLAFRSRVAAVNPVVITFDPVTMRAGAPQLLDTRMHIRVPSDVSPDGKLVAYFNIGERQEDAFLASPDGTMRRVTDDPARDRGPVFTPDGRSLLFYSNRSGNWGVWAINADGSNLRKVSEPSSGAIVPVVSPKGDAVVFSSAGANGEVWSLPLASGADATPSLLPDSTIAGKSLVPTSWSPDGARLAGYVVGVSGRPSGVGLYDLAGRKATLVSDDPVDAAKWLADSRRLVYFTRHRNELVVFDTVSRARTVLDVRLPGPPTNDVFAVSRDNRTIYYGAVRSEADIWIVERK